MREKGFSLIELLVVISIIGILMALSINSYTKSQRQARDSQRKSDIAQYKSALENFANAHNNFYPFAGGQGLTKMVDVCKAALTSYVNGCPEDPYPRGRAYYYRTNGSGNIGDTTATTYFIYVWGNGLETDNTKTWIVCSNGKSGTINNDWSYISVFCQ